MCRDVWLKSEEVIFMNAWKLFTLDSVDVLMQHLLKKSEEPYVVKAYHKDRSIFEVELKGRDFEIAGEPVRSVSIKKVA